MEKAQICPQCDKDMAAADLKCPHCGGHVRHKTFREAYSWGGLGLFDLIPGVRDLPYPARFTLMAITVIVLVLLIVPPVVALIVPLVLHVLG